MELKMGTSTHPRRVSDIITQPGDVGRYGITMQYMFCVRAHAIFRAVLIQNMPEFIKGCPYGRVLSDALPVVDAMRPPLADYEWSAGMQRHFNTFRDIVNEYVWDDTWKEERIDRWYTRLLFCADSLLADVTTSCDYFTRRMPQWEQLHDVMTDLVDGPLRYSDTDANYGFKIYERIRGACG